MQIHIIDRGDNVLLHVDNKTLIDVKDFGNSLYRFHVYSTDKDNRDYNPEAMIIDSLAPKEKNYTEEAGFIHLFGCAGIYFEPITFAHAVMDLINNR